jgi:hypothetical protein
VGDAVDLPVEDLGGGRAGDGGRPRLVHLPAS